MNAQIATGTVGAQAGRAAQAGWLSWLWLVIGAALLPFTIFQTVLPLAAWLAPVFLLRFTRTQRAWVALPVLAASGYLATLVAARGFIPAPEIYMIGLMGLGVVVAYAADKLFAPRLSGVLRTLVFPLADTSLAFLTSGGEFGTFGASAYTQAANLQLVQLASVTGLWGLNFLIAWFAPVANEVWERGFELRAARVSVGIFAGSLAAVLLLGGVRLAFIAPGAPTVRVAALAPDRSLSDRLNQAQIPAHPRAAEQRAAFREAMFEPLLDDLFLRTQQAARSGARIVAWAEAAGFYFKEDEAALIERAQQVARQEGIYLELGLVFFLPTDGYPQIENRAILIDPDGAVRWDYHKTTVPLGDGNAPGPGIVPVVDTPYGKLATVICYDADFPPLVRQAGQSGADILLVPSSDWPPVAEMHARMAAFRAVENGLSLVRPTRQGVSLAVDYQGRLLGYKPDYFVSDDHTMMVNVPVKGQETLYARWGDSLAYLFVAGFIGLAGLAIFRRGTGAGVP